MGPLSQFHGDRWVRLVDINWPSQLVYLDVQCLCRGDYVFWQMLMYEADIFTFSVHHQVSIHMPLPQNSLSSNFHSLSFQTTHQIARPLMTALKHIYILISGHFSLDTKWKTRCTVTPLTVRQSHSCDCGAAAIHLPCIYIAS